MVEGACALPSMPLGTMSRRPGVGATRTRDGGVITLAMTRMTGNNYNNTHTCDKHIIYIIWYYIMPTYLLLTLQCQSHPMTHYSIEYHHHIHALDESGWGENGSCGRQGLHHHVNPLATMKHTKHGWDKSFSYYEPHRNLWARKDQEMCPGTHLCVPEKKELNTAIF